MYLSSASRTRFALGPGSAVLICGPTAVKVLGVMGSSGILISWSSVVRRGWSQADGLQPLIFHTGRRLTNRCRRGWGALAMGALPDGGVDTLRSATSILANASWDFVERA